MRKSLLDLSRRNRLLNFRGTGRGSVAIVDELPEEIWRIVVGESKTMRFLSSEEALDGATLEQGASDEGDLDEPVRFEQEDRDGGEASLHPRHSDRYLQTTLEAEALQTRLLHLAREARAGLEERGCNTLFLTLGMIEWTDPSAGDVVSKAPLLFVPVGLSRKNVNSRHHVSILDEDVVVNPCLLELAARQFRVKLPDLPADQEIDLSAFFESVQDVIEDVPGWGFLDEIHLGLFSFAKLLLYRDLDHQNWPEKSGLEDHPLVRLLLGAPDGAGFAGEGVPSTNGLDRLDPADSYQVVDADSSQRAAIQAVRNGESLVIQGPPGTGKSQTITNIIAECMAAGKTVLFVAEKAAALEVVHRRLEAVGLRDFLLELHSRNTSKRAVLEQIEKALRAGNPTSGRSEAEHDGELKQLRDGLNRYVEELHRPIGALEISPFDAMVRAGQLRTELEVPFDLPDPFSWTASELDQAVERVGALDRCLARVGDLRTHPWRGAGLTSAGLDVRQKIMARREPVLESLSRLSDLAMSLTEGLRAAVPETTGEVEKLLADLAVLQEADERAAEQVETSAWDTLDAPLEQWLGKGREREARRARWASAMLDEAEGLEWSAILDRRRVDGTSFLRFFKPSWYADGRRLKAYLKSSQLPDQAEQVELLRALQDSRKLRSELEAEQDRFSPLFAGVYTGADGDFAALERFARTMIEIRQIVRRGALGVESIRTVLRAEDRTGLKEATARTRAQLDDFRRMISQWLEVLSGDERAWFGDELDQTPLDAVAGRFRGLELELERLQDWVDTQRVLDSCQGEKLASFLQFALGKEGGAGRGRLMEIFQRQFYFLFADRSLTERESLATFRGEDFRERIVAFRAADRAWLEQSRKRLRQLLAGRRPDFSHDANRESKLGILKHEMRKKRRHMPLRKLFGLVGDVVQGIKPCFMMSPISVAQYLAPGKLSFDVVIFDEASQVEPADAFGAIARARQLLLIGDEKQLPPTNFFTKFEGDEVADDVGEELALPSDLESILGLGAVRFPSRNQCSLRWHYRSLHESLIEFSNAQFYDHRLRVFPSTHADRSELGLVFRHVEDGVYNRGAGHTNKVEAVRVAEEVMRHAAESPSLSLGVGAFSMSQQRAIEDQVELMRRRSTNRQAETFFREHEDEPFFVKNLETIQGDERDVILLSVGYGPDQKGKVSMNMGPLNREGGWRRLNVLITRAKRRCVVFSSMLPEQIRPESTRSRGVLALKGFLQAAAAAGGTGDGGSGRAVSTLEDLVREALVQKDWEVRGQVGCEGFSVDLGIVDPDRSGRYLMGVECDGALYFEAATARDRDRTRPEVLAARGWNLARIWSIDWFRRPEAVIERIDARLRKLLKKAPGKAAKEPAGPLEEPKPEMKPEPKPKEPSRAKKRANSSRKSSPAPAGMVAYQRVGEKSLGDQERLLSLPADRVGKLITEIVRKEGPLHESEALRLLTGWFSTRATKQPKAAFEAGLAAALDSKSVERRGDFLWRPDTEEILVRLRGDDCPVTDADLIPPEEFQAAVRLTLKKNLGIPADALVQATCSLIGFKRSGTRLAEAIELAAAEMREQGLIQEDDSGFLTLA